MRKNQGFSLIEVLVTLLLTTIGILGMVTLQSNTVRYTQDAINRNHAATLSNDLIQIMRQYPNEFWAHTPEPYDALKNDTFLYGSDGDMKTPAKCTSNPETASAQIACWAERLKISLPDARVKVCPSFNMASTNFCAGSNFRGSSMGIQLTWAVREGECMDGTEGTTCSYATWIEL